MTILIANTDQEILLTYPVMKQLRPHLDEASYVSTIRQLMSEFGYTLILLIEGDVARAAAGFRICHTLASGRFLYVDDLITDEDSRARGYALQLFQWMEQEAASLQCAAVHLDSGVQRFDAHRFYLKQGMRISCHHFDKPI